MIELQGLGGRLGDFVLRDINLTVQDGEYLVILGPTGAGKTVLLEYIAGINRPGAGVVLVDGTDITAADMEARNIGYVPQDYCLFPNLTVEQNIGYGLAARKAPAREVRDTVDRILRVLSIEQLRKRMPLHLSGGERQRVALGRAMAVRPRLVLLDEPLSALDENMRSTMARELRQVQRELGGTFLHVCHNFEEAADVADRIAIMQEGRIIQTGTLEGLMRKPASEFVARFLRTANLFPAEARSTRLFIGALELACDQCRGGKVLAGIRPEHIIIENGTDASGQNCLPAVVSTVRRKVSWTEITLRGAISLVAHSMGEPEHLRPGQNVTVRIPPEKIILIEQDAAGTC